MHLHIRFTSNGIGDNLVAMTAVASLRRAYPDARITYATHPKVLPWLEPFRDVDAYTTLDESVPADKTFEPYPGVWDRELNEQGKTPRHTLYANALGLDNAAQPRTAITPARYTDRFKGYVVLFPHTSWPSREWPMPHWFHLDKRLNDAGWFTLALGVRPMKTFAKRVRNLAPKKVIDILTGCAIAVCNDSGMAHLCGLMSVPCVVLCGGTDGGCVYGHYDTAMPVQSSMQCSGCYWQGPYCVEGCHSSCASLGLIHPDSVFNMLSELLE